jgi:hypothetical protein
MIINQRFHIETEESRCSLMIKMIEERDEEEMDEMKEE